jgi:hypothetical protein
MRSMGFRSYPRGIWTLWGRFWYSNRLVVPQPLALVMSFSNGLFNPKDNKRQMMFQNNHTLRRFFVVGLAIVCLFVIDSNLRFLLFLRVVCMVGVFLYVRALRHAELRPRPSERAPRYHCGIRTLRTATPRRFLCAWLLYAMRIA